MPLWRSFQSREGHFYWKPTNLWKTKSLVLLKSLSSFLLEFWYQYTMCASAVDMYYPWLRHCLKEIVSEKIKKYPFQIFAPPLLDVSCSRAPGGRSGSTILATWSWGEGPEGPTAEGLEEQGGDYGGDYHGEGGNYYGDGGDYHDGENHFG